MDRFIWGKDYKIGVPEMDCDHLVLFAIYNQLAAVIDNEKEDEGIDDIFNALVTYIKMHFGREETMLERACYAKLAEHRQAHRTIITELENLYGMYLKDRSPAVARDLRSFVFSWLTGHILRDDKAYAIALAAD